MLWGKWVKVPAEELGGSLTLKRDACLDCLITKNPPEVGLARSGRFIHHSSSEHPTFLWYIYYILDRKLLILFACC
jgi:hypothetical protein